MPFVLVHGARQLLTLRGSPGPRRGPEMNQLQIIGDGAVLIEDEVVREVGPARRIENLAAARKAREISAAGRVVMPAFVDSHTHLISAPPRFGAVGTSTVSAAAEDASVPANLSYARDTPARRLSADAISVLRKCVAYGTATLEAKSGYGLTQSSELKILRVLTALGEVPVEVVPTLFAARTVPPEFAGRPAEYLAWASNELLPAAHRRRIARFVDGSCDSPGFTSSELMPYFIRARQLGFALKLHAAQFSPSDAATLAAAFPFASIDHLDHATPADVEVIARSGAVVTLTPAASFFRRSGPYAPARELIAAGVPVALASNFCRAGTPTSSMQMVVFLASHELGMTPAQAIVGATINGAHALGIGHRVGSLEPGKQADLLILNAGDHRELVHQFGMNLVGMTMKRGTVVFDSTGVKWPARS